MPTTPFAEEHEALRAVLGRLVDDLAPAAPAWEADRHVGDAVLQQVASTGALALAGDPLAAVAAAEALGRLPSGGAVAVLLGQLAAAAVLPGAQAEQAAAGQLRVAVAETPVDSDGDRLTGVVAGVPGAAAALVVPLAAGGWAVVALGGVPRRPAPLLGLDAADLGQVVLDAVPGSPLPAADGRWRATVDAATAAATVAGAEMALEQALVHARTREAFGRPIGRFQVNRHALAAAATAVTGARALVREAAWHLAASDERGEPLAAAARLRAAAVAAAVTDRCLQLHGGAGYTMDLDVQRAWRDARSASPPDRLLTAAAPGGTRRSGPRPAAPLWLT